MACRKTQASGLADDQSRISLAMSLCNRSCKYSCDGVVMAVVNCVVIIVVVMVVVDGDDSDNNQFFLVFTIGYSNRYFPKMR